MVPPDVAARWEGYDYMGLTALGQATILVPSQTSMSFKTLRDGGVAEFAKEPAAQVIATKSVVEFVHWLLEICHRLEAPWLCPSRYPEEPT